MSCWIGMACEVVDIEQKVPWCSKDVALWYMFRCCK